MTKKDYEHAAEVVQEIANQTTTQVGPIIAAFCIFFAADSDRFDEARFRRTRS